MCRHNSHHQLNIVLVFALSLYLKFAKKKGHFPILVAIFVTIATVKVELIPDFYTWASVQINW